MYDNVFEGDAKLCRIRKDGDEYELTYEMFVEGNLERLDDYYDSINDIFDEFEIDQKDLVVCDVLIMTVDKNG